MITVGDIVDYVLANRRGKAFVDWSREHITDSVINGMKNNTIFYALNTSNEVVGVVVGIKYASIKVVHVSAILTTQKGVLRKFVSMLNKFYPGWLISACRHDRNVEYSGDKLGRKLLSRKT